MNIYRACIEEQETTLRYDPIDKLWHAWSNITRDVERMKANGWKVKREDAYGAEFTAPRIAVKLDKAEKRQLTEAQKAALRERLSRNKNSPRNQGVADAL